MTVVLYLRSCMSNNLGQDLISIIDLIAPPDYNLIRSDEGDVSFVERS